VFAAIPLALVVGCGPSGSGAVAPAAAVSTAAPTPSDTYDPLAGLPTDTPTTAAPVVAPPINVPTTQAPVQGDTSAAQRVADYDGVADITPYTTALDALSTCSDSRDDLASYAIFGSKDEAQHGITETGLSFLQSIATARAGISDCKGVAAAYTVLREG
jgi:hypothetical protein